MCSFLTGGLEMMFSLSLSLKGFRIGTATDILWFSMANVRTAEKVQLQSDLRVWALALLLYRNYTRILKDKDNNMKDYIPLRRVGRRFY